MMLRLDSRAPDTNGKARFLDNLIPLRGDTFGPQLAGWTPGPPVATGLGCRVYANQMIPVGDGVAVAADVYTPKRPGRYPAVVAFAAYSKELHSSGAPTATNEGGSPPIFTDRGHVHIIASRRGMGRSEGASTVYFNDQDVSDHAKIIQWAAEQPWCDGNVVTFGTSYYGITQPQVAAKQPPALKGFFTIRDVHRLLPAHRDVRWDATGGIPVAVDEGTLRIPRRSFRFRPL